MMNRKGGIFTILEPYLKKFFMHCLSINLQTTTIKAYEYKLKLFNEYISQESINSVENITADNIRCFLFEQSKRLGKVSVKHYYSTLRIFFNFLVAENVLAYSPMRSVSTPKIPKRQLRTFTNNETKLLLNHFDKNSFIGFRNYVIMNTLFASGMRITELCNLHCTDIFFEVSLINIIGKGDKQRHVPISPVLKKLLLAYFKRRNEYITENGLQQSRYFFITRKATQIHRDNVAWLFIKIKRYYGIEGKRFSAHTFRHTFAKAFILNGGDIFSLQKILGHSKIEDTKKYIELNETEVKVQNEKFNPLDNSRWQYY